MKPPDHEHESDTRLAESTRLMPPAAAERTRLAPRQEAPPGSPSAGHGGAALAVGSVIKQRFELTRCLGEGGMSVVYQALDRRKAEARDSDPYIAIKVLSREVAEHPEAFVALQRETRKAQQLAHPNIITVFDFDRDGDTVFMTMEQLRGESLSQLIGRHPLGVPAKQAHAIIGQMCRGLAYAHAKHIIHSDLKPSNVFICEDKTVKLLDFGIARASAAAQDGAGDDPADFAGFTPTYASLEMLEGQAPENADDIYSLGLVCYELLTGRHPYQRLRAVDALARGLVAEPIAHVGRRRWRAVERAIALRREQRCASVQAFARQYRGRGKTTTALWAASAVAALSTILAGYGYATRGAPVTEFTALPPATQEQVTAALESGREALLFEDFNGALHFYDLAHSLHPGNRTAAAGLRKVVDRVLATDADAADRAALDAQLEQVETLMSYPSLANDRRLLRHREKLLARQSRN